MESDSRSTADLTTVPNKIDFRRMTDLGKLARQLLSDGPHKVETTSRRVRALFDGIYIFDVTNARHVWEHPYYPQYYVPIETISSGHLTKRDPTDDSGSAFYGQLTGVQRSTDRVLIFEKGPLAGLVKLDFDAMDTWFEEDTPIYQHPKDPYKRIDILPSTRTVTVKIDGVTLARSSANMFLLETGLRTRYYMPKTSLDWRYVVESETTTRCPYKGLANYYTVQVNGKEYPDVIWWYRYPTHESSPVANLVCFYEEKVDLSVDGPLGK